MKANGENSFTDLVSFLESQLIKFSIKNSDKNSLIIRIEVIAKPNSKKEGITIKSSGLIVVAVNAQPIEGKANEAIISLLSKSLGISKSSIELLKGSESKIKLLDLYFLQKEGKDQLYFISKWKQALKQ